MTADPPPTDFPETADIETSSDDYATRFAGPEGEWMLRVQEDITLAMLADASPSSILDVGGGHGQLAIPLSRKGYDLTVLGSSDSCRTRIREIIDAGACRFVTGNVIDLPFPDNSFDAVIAFRMVTHCQRWPELVAELCRVARRHVIVDYPTSQSVNAIAPALFGAKKKLEVNTRTWTLFRHRQVLDAFARHGYAPHRRKKQFFFPMVLHRMLKCRPLSAAMESTARALGLTALWGSPVIIDLVRRSPR
jgi:ubiquinone/menaquinone biosynthesis C-methylase UbiE